MAEPDEPSYSFKPSLIGAPCVLRLTGEGLAFEFARRRGVIRYDRIRQVRLAFRPVSMQSYRFIADIRSSDAAKVQIASSSWRSIADQQRQDRPYAEFIVELHRRMIAADSGAEFVAGLPVALFGVGVVVFVAMLASLAMLVLRALEGGQTVGAAVVVGVFAIFGWQAGNYLKRNRPATYRPDALPGDVLPKL